MKEAKHKLKRIERTEEKYELSRWTPVVKDIAEVNTEVISLAFCLRWCSSIVRLTSLLSVYVH